MKKAKHHVLTFPKTKSYMQKSQNSIMRFSGKTSTERQRERKRDRDGPEYKGPPDAIAKPSDQKGIF